MSEVGERGPKGDHGQAGDTGDTGGTGLAGQAGERGPSGGVGERGPVGDVGRTGESGPRGPEGKSTVLSRNVTVSFLAVVGSAVAVLAVMGWQINSNRELIHSNRVLIRDGIQAHDGLCAVKDNTRVRIRQTEEFLLERPNGVSGIPAVTIQQAIDRDKTTLRALAVVKCP